MKDAKIKEPSLIVRPIGKYGGLDSLHLTLAALVIVLFALLLLISYGKGPIGVMNTTVSNTTGCGNSTTTGNCTTHNASQIKVLAERVLASYSGINGSLSLLPFISNISTMQAVYLPTSRYWFVNVRAKNLVGSFAFNASFLINDRNTSQVVFLLQSVRPPKLSNNSVVSYGVVQLGGKYACINQNPTKVYWFIDPYASGSVQSLLNATDIRQLYGSKVNVTMKTIAGSDTQRIASSVGLSNALYLSKYTLCASQQSSFGAYVQKLNTVYNGSYVPQSVLASISNSSGLNPQRMNACISNSSEEISRAALLAQVDGVTQTPLVVVNCKYLAIPQTAREALCYTNSTLC